MNRLTNRDEEGAVHAFCEECELLARLACYEDAHEAVLEEYDRVKEQIDQAKSQGKMRGVRANQLIAQKMSLQNVLSYFKRFGIGD